jgi:enoyl-CoA hydratase
MKNLILLEESNGLCMLTLNRPDKLNALNLDIFIELRKHVEGLEHKLDTIGCVVLKGSGQCFSAGHDLKDIGAKENQQHDNFEAETIERLAHLPQTVISAVHGHCYTGALELALAGDIIIAAASAKFADTHARWALTPIWGMSQRLPRRIGLPKAKEMMLTARTYSAKEAVAIGLANMWVPDEQFDAEVAALVKQILSNSWFSNRANKRLLEKTDGMPLSEGLKYEIEQGEGSGPDMLERISAFGKKK